MTSCRYLFSIPNRYLYSGMIIHTLDMFYLCEPETDAQPQAADDAEDCRWMPLHEIHPEEFGLKSISQAVSRFLESY